MPMNSNQLYGFRSYLESSLWVVSFIAIPVEFAVTWILCGVSAWLGWSATAHPNFSGRLSTPDGRQPTWDLACALTGDMLREVIGVGGLEATGLLPRQRSGCGMLGVALDGEC